MKESWPQVKDPDYFPKKIVVGFYPNIAHGAGLEALKKDLMKGKYLVPTEELIKMTDFILKNNFFEFNWEV